MALNFITSWNVSAFVPCARAGAASMSRSAAERPPPVLRRERKRRLAAQHGNLRCDFKTPIRTSPGHARRRVYFLVYPSGREKTPSAIASVEMGRHRRGHRHVADLRHRGGGLPGALEGHLEFWASGNSCVGHGPLHLHHGLGLGALGHERRRESGVGGGLTDRPVLVHARPLSAIQSVPDILMVMDSWPRFIGTVISTA